MTEENTHPQEEFNLPNATIGHSGGLTAQSVREALAKQHEPGSPPPAKQESLALPIFWLITMGALSAFVLGALDVIAVEGFVNNAGTWIRSTLGLQYGSDAFPFLWIAEVLVSVIISVALINNLDRMHALKAMQWALVGLGSIYAVLSAAIILQVNEQILYPTFYLLYSQQNILFPIVFWNLAGSVFGASQARRFFPILAAGEIIGKLIGYSMFSVPSMLGAESISTFIKSQPILLIGGSAVLFFVGLALSAMAIRNVTPPRTTIEAKPGLVESFTAGLRMIREVPFFKNLMALNTLLWVALAFIWYLAYIQFENAGENFTRNYSIYQIISLSTNLVLQLYVVGRVLRRIDPQHTFRPTAIIYIFAFGLSLASLALPANLSIIILVSLLLCTVLERSWHSPIVQSNQKLIPNERRALVSTMLNTYSYALGTILGSLALIALAFLRLRIPAEIMPLILGVLVAIGMLYFAVQIARTYEDSMFSSKLARRARKESVLGKLTTSTFSRDDVKEALKKHQEENKKDE